MKIGCQKREKGVKSGKWILVACFLEGRRGEKKTKRKEKQKAEVLSLGASE